MKTKLIEYKIPVEATIISGEIHPEAQKHFDREDIRRRAWLAINPECPLKDQSSHSCKGRAPQANGSAPWSCFWYACPRIVDPPPFLSEEIKEE